MGLVCGQSYDAVGASTTPRNAQNKSGRWKELVVMRDPLARTIKGRYRHLDRDIINQAEQVRMAVAYRGQI
jgi:hypothetical protein